MDIQPKILIVSEDKTTCVSCPCFPKEDPWVKNKKLNQCQKSPLSLYELACAVVDSLAFPDAFLWETDDVAQWICDIGFPQYMDCIKDNNINGRRLLMLEDPSLLPEINIHYWSHIKIINSKIHELFATEYVKFIRSICLPYLYPLTHCTWFDSRTGPSWGIRQNWTRTDVLRWMKILKPRPVYLDHWHLVWYRKPDFPKTKFARIPKANLIDDIVRYNPEPDVCNEYLTPRRYKLLTNVSDSKQNIWMEKLPGFEEEVKKKLTPCIRKKVNNIINYNKLRGKELLMFKRKMDKSKFFL